MISFIICVPHQIKEAAVGGTCNTHGGDEKCM